MFEMLLRSPENLLSLSGPPGPPGGVRVDEVTSSSVRVTWSHGTDNLSPISKYSVQYRDVREQQDWRDASTCQYITALEISVLHQTLVSKAVLLCLQLQSMWREMQKWPP